MEHKQNKQIGKELASWKTDPPSSKTCEFVCVCLAWKYSLIGHHLWLAPAVRGKSQGWKMNNKIREEILEGWELQRHLVQKSMYKNLPYPWLTTKLYTHEGDLKGLNIKAANGRCKNRKDHREDRAGACVQQR